MTRPNPYLQIFIRAPLCFIMISSNVDVKSQPRMKQETIEIAQSAPIGRLEPTSKTNPENAQRRNKVVMLTIPLANLPR